MRLKYFPGIIAAGCVLLIALGGCIHQQNRGAGAPEKTDVQPQTGKYIKEITNQEQTILTSADTSERTRAHLELAHLYTSYKNPQRNYKKALKHLEIYASLEPDFANDKDLRNWLSALKEIERLAQKLESQDKEVRQLNKKLDQSRRKITGFKNKTRQLKKKNNQLAESNASLEKTIEMLKNIDRNIEEKRKTYTQ
jgi:DNA mismatch repair ATPase MutS